MGGAAIDGADPDRRAFPHDHLCALGRDHGPDCPLDHQRSARDGGDSRPFTSDSIGGILAGMPASDSRIGLRELKQLLDYDPVTGNFYWKVVLYRGKTRIGQVAGSFLPGRYIRIGLNGRSYLAHRLAWFYITGAWPKKIDHKDRNKQNNSWDNLRIATHSQNLANSRMHIRNLVGFKGVSPYRGAKNFIVTINYKKKQKIAGYFDDAVEAAKAYDSAARQFYGEFAATNFR